MLFATIGLFVPAFAQNVPQTATYADAVNDAKNCRKMIQDDDKLSEVQKITAKRACSTEASKKIVGDVEIKNKRLHELKIKNLIQCESWHDNYKISTLETFKILKPRQLADDCIKLYNDEIWNYKGKDRSQKLLDRADELSLFQIAKIKSQLSAKDLPPLKQVEEGVPKTHVDCKTDYVLIYKILNKKPSCVKIESANLLIARGWGSLTLP